MISSYKYFMYGLKYVVRKHILNKKEPFIAGLVVGESCNLECKHCNVSNSLSNNDLSFEEVKIGLLKLYNEGIRLLAITGGEPFIWKDNDKSLEDIIDFAKSIGFLIISVYTNGTKKLETKADNIFVSLDGLKDSNTKLRGPVYDKIIENIEKSSHKNIIVNCTINSKNKNDLEDLCEFVSSIDNINGIFFYFHTPYYGKDELFIPFIERQKIILEIIELKKKYKILNSRGTLLDVYNDSWERPSKVCKVFSKNKVYTCCRSVENKEACKECGYLGYPEVINIVNLKPSAIWTALSYMPKE